MQHKLASPGSRQFQSLANHRTEIVLMLLKLLMNHKTEILLILMKLLMKLLMK